MALQPSNTCSNCGRVANREQLTVKKVQFSEMGQGAATLRSRVVAWLCNSCLESDMDWNRPRLRAPKGLVS